MRATQQSLVFVHQGSSYRPFEVTAYNEKNERFYQLTTDSGGCRDCRVVSAANFIYIYRSMDYGDGSLMNSLLCFDPRHFSLLEMQHCSHLRMDSAVVAKGDWLYVIGGMSDTYVSFASVEAFNTKTDTWMDAASLPQATHALAGVACGDMIYLSGGVVDRQPTNTLICYNPGVAAGGSAGPPWTHKSPMQVARRLHEMLCIDDRTLYVIGGIGGHTYNNQNTQIPIEYYNINTDQWTVLSGTLAGRSVGHFPLYRGKILSVGREHLDATEEEIWEYDIANDSWKSFARIPRKAGLAAVHTGLLYVNFNDEKLSNKIISDRR